MTKDLSAEATEVKAMMEAATRGEIEMAVYTSREQLYEDLGLSGEA